MAEQLLHRAEELKEEGNHYFKQSLFSNAKSSYGKALAYVKGIPGSKRTVTGFEQIAPSTTPPLSKELDESAKELEKILYQNIATCYLKLNKPNDAISNCNKALQIDANSWKALLRKGQANIALNDYERARELLDKAISECDNDASAIATIQREFTNIENLNRKYDAQERKKYASMFSKANKSSDEKK
jgi:tetratricopeptide (TPR) repeat protein